MVLGQVRTEIARHETAILRAVLMATVATHAQFLTFSMCCL